MPGRPADFRDFTAAWYPFRVNGWYARVLQEITVATAQMVSRHPSPLENHPGAKALRIQSGVSIDSISERTKISRYFLEAIEERAYHLLPGGVFDINWIRQYSESVGCNADVLLADYHAVSRRSDPEDCASPANKLSKTWWRNILLIIWP